jgi:hypothetical protein
MSDSRTVVKCFPSELTMRRAVLLVTALATSSCRDATGPTPAAVVTVAEQSVEQHASGSLVLRFEAEVRNISSRPVYQMGCSGSLERITPAGQWESVWSVICLLVTNVHEIVIAPGQSRVTPMVIHVASGSADTILPPAGEDATYRFRLSVLVENDLAAMRFEHGRIAQQVTSNAFQVARPD